MKKVVFAVEPRYIVTRRATGEDGAIEAYAQAEGQHASATDANNRAQNLFEQEKRDRDGEEVEVTFAPLDTPRIYTEAEAAEHNRLGDESRAASIAQQAADNEELMRLRKLEIDLSAQREGAVTGEQSHPIDTDEQAPAPALGAVAESVETFQEPNANEAPAEDAEKSGDAA